MSNRKLAYAASVDLTITLASLASSATLVAGRSSLAVDNSANLYLDYLLAGEVETGTTPGGNTIEIWVVGMQNDTDWPDTFGGADAAVTVSDRSALLTYGRLAATMLTDGTSNKKYYFGPVSVAALFGGTLPRKWGIFVVQNTTVNLNATAGNHKVSQTGVYETV